MKNLVDILEGALAGVFLLVVLSQGPQLPPPWWLVYLLPALLLERRAPVLEGFGFLPLAAPIYLALGPFWGSLGLLLGQLVRWAPGREALPLLLTQALVARFSELGPLAGLIYAPLALFYPLLRSYLGEARAAEESLRRAGVYLVLGCLAVGCGWLGPERFWVLLPVLFLLPTRESPAELQSQVTLEEERLQHLRSRGQADEVEAFAYAVGGYRRADELASAALKSFLRISGARGGALFARQGAQFELVSLQGKATVTRVPELVERAWEGGALQSDHDAAAIPWEREAVVYLVGDPQQLELLGRLARLAAPAWRNVHEKEQRVALGKAGAELESWVNTLGKLLQSAQRVGGTLDPAELLEELHQTLVELTAPEACFVILPELRKSWLEVPESRVRPQRLQELVEQVAEQGPLHLEKELPVAGQRVGVALPLGEGALILTSSHQRGLPASSLRFLTVLAGLVSTFLGKAELYQKLERSQSELAQATKMAAVGQLAAGVAHEINNPLMAMQVHLELLRDALEDDEDLEAADTIKEAIERCQNIVSQLLAFSRKQEQPPGPVEVEALVAEVARLSGVSFSSQLEPGLALLGHREEISGALANLVKNADYAARQNGSPRVEVAATAADGLVKLAVSDNGPGMTKEVAGRVFEPFFTTKPVGSGTGLGLYLAYTHAKAAGGRLYFETRPGQGSTFYLELPRA